MRWPYCDTGLILIENACTVELVEKALGSLMDGIQT